MNRLFDLVVTDYEVKKRKSASQLRERLHRHLLPYFGHRPAAAVTSEIIAEHLVSRQPEKRPAKDATINRST